MKRFLFFILISAQLIGATAQTTCTTNVKGLYVNDFKFIIGNTAAENELLTYAQDSGFNYLILYNLYYIHNNLFDITGSVTSLPLSDFINTAKTVYGIHAVAGVGETFDSFENIHAYNQLHLGDVTKRIAVYHMEFEFWNNSTTGPGGYYCTSYLLPEGLSCDTANAFDFYLEELCQLDSLCDANEYVSSETYIGNPTVGQCTQLSGCADRILVHYYKTSDTYVDGSSIYNYKSYRLPALAAASELSRVMPIFNCREDYMEEWLMSNSQDQAMDTWLNGVDGYNEDTGDWKDSTCVEGHVWYRYTCMNSDALLTSVLDEPIDGFSFYPNPTSSTLTIDSDKANLQSSEITVYDQLGRVLPNKGLSYSDDKVVLDVNHFEPGSYYLRVDGANRSFVVLR